MNGVLINVATEDGLRVVWLDMFSRTPFTVTTCTYFIVERTVDFVLLGSFKLANDHKEERIRHTHKLKLESLP